MRPPALLLAIPALALTAACGDDPLAPRARRAPLDAPALALVPGAAAVLPTVAGVHETPQDLARDISADGRVVGQTRMEDGTNRAVVWVDGAAQLLPGGEPEHESRAIGISPNGRHVVGALYDPHVGAIRPVLWTDGALPRFLLPASAPSDGEAVAVNDAGLAVGWFIEGEGATRAFAWQAGTFTPLGTLGGALSRAVAVNAAGQVVGMAEDDDGEMAPFLWQHGAMTALPHAGVSAEVRDINDAGVAVGAVEVANYDLRPALWNGAALPTFVPIGVDADAEAIAINNDGLVVGLHQGQNDAPSWNFVWRAGEAVTELPEAPISPYTPSVMALNDAGEIVGFAGVGDWGLRAIRWARPHVESNRAPTASAGGPYASIVEGSTVLFDGAGADPDGDALTYAWTFGDGTTATGAKPAHVYADNGTYTATLVVTDAHGASATSSAVVTVTNAAPAFKTLKLDHGILNAPKVGQGFPIGIVFTDRGTRDAWTWTIEWGDGATSTGTKSTLTQIDDAHHYATAGARTVRFTVRDKDGASFSKAIAVVVTP